MRTAISFLFAIGATAAIAPFASAHFKLLAPDSWVVESNLGDPQKLGPCGGTSKDGGMPTNLVTKVQGGSKLHIKLQETVYHPGHYRVSLAVNSRAELPEDPKVVTRDPAGAKEKGPQSVSAPIDPNPKPPVLADGLFVHNMRPADQKSAPPWETDIQLPNISCAKCTLQIVQFMAEHGVNADGGFFYHHCAELNITADPSKPVDAAWMKK
jgi:hypothetical protein